MSRVDIKPIAEPASAEDSPPSWRAFAASGVGLEMGLYVLLGFVAGRWLDGYFGTDPGLMIALVLFGVLLATIAMVRASRAAWNVGAESPSSGQVDTP